MSHESDAELYHLAMTRAAEAWIERHPDAYFRMAAGVMKGYTGKIVGDWRRRMAWLNRSCAEAAGWPSYGLWLRRRETPQQSEAA